jgi:hypothetical protein
MVENNPTVGFSAESELTDNFSPLMESVNQKSYTRPKVENADATPIAEPVINPPTFEQLESGFQASMNENEVPVDDRKVWGQTEEPSSANPYVENLDKKDQRTASSAMVEAVLDGYSQLNSLAGKLVQFNIKKVQKSISNGEIDPNLLIPVSGTPMTPIEYMLEYNAQTKNIITVSDEFKDKVRPLLVDIFMERNIGMTKEQLLGYYVFTDVATKAVMIYGLMGQNKELISSLKEMSAGFTQPPQAVPTQFENTTTQNTTQERVYEEPRPTQEFQRETPTESPRETPKREREFVEPEEVKVKEEFQEAQVVDSVFNEEPIVRAKASSKMPKFGNQSILNQMEKIASKDNQVKSTRGRKRKS